MLKVVDLLQVGRIPFSVHYPSDTSWVITVKGAVSNHQLKVLTGCGAMMSPDGTFMILGENNVED